MLLLRAGPLRRATPTGAPGRLDRRGLRRTRLVAQHERAVGRYVEVLCLDHYLEVLKTKPGGLPGATALAQAKARGVFTASHQAYWDPPDTPAETPAAPAP